MMQLNLDLDQKYGIMLSGGLDSAILLYTILKNNASISIQPFTIPKVDGSIEFVNPLIQYFNETFYTDIPKTIQVGDPSVHHRLQSKTAVTDIFRNHKIDLLFIALNQNPPELTNIPGAPNRSTKSDNPKILMPFVNMHKDEILQIMYDFDQAYLAEITHSCTEQQIGRCSCCWQCTERAWAFSKLGKIDPGSR